jgi:threonylcarbamoyladenosine tRNA methylthiotransferase MtaB
MSRSVEPRRIFAAIDELHARGFREVILSGVHLGGYGKDLDPPVELADLLEMLAERSPIDRIRISSLDPEELSDRIIDIIARSEKFCAHFHLPLQAGEDGTLARMRRRYDTAHFRDRVERIIDAMPDAGIGTDIIVGFPGETPRDFEQSFRFVEDLPLSYFHVFPYSVRAGTTAAKLAGKVGACDIKQRGARMRELGERKREIFAEKWIGHKLKVLLEESTEDGELGGYSRNYVRVLTRGAASQLNRELEVEASFAKGARLVGEIVEVREAPAPRAATAIL